MKEVVRDVGPALTSPQGGESARCLPGTVRSIGERCCLWKCQNVWRKWKKKKYKHEAHSHYPRRHRAEVLPQRPLPESHAGSLHRCKEQTFGLCSRRRGWDDLRE